VLIEWNLTISFQKNYFINPASVNKRSKKGTIFNWLSAT